MQLAVICGWGDACSALVQLGCYQHRLNESVCPFLFSNNAMCANDTTVLCSQIKKKRLLLYSCMVHV